MKVCLTPESVFLIPLLPYTYTVRQSYPSSSPSECSLIMTVPFLKAGSSQL